jgi:hypothetical protein
MVLFQYLFGGAEENHENLRQNSRSTRRNRNLVPPEYEAGVLTIRLLHSLKTVMVNSRNAHTEIWRGTKPSKPILRTCDLTKFNSDFATKSPLDDRIRNTFCLAQICRPVLSVPFIIKSLSVFLWSSNCRLMYNGLCCSYTFLSAYFCLQAQH